MDEREYESVRRQMGVELLVDCWIHESDVLGFQDNPEEVRHMMELMYDGAGEDVVAAMLPLPLKES